MFINEIIISALAPLSLPCDPDVHTGDAEEYLTFSCESTGDEFGDDAPLVERYNVVIHYCCPLSTDSVAKREQIKRLLSAADFSWPDMIDSTDENGQDWIFECERLLGVDAGG
jgi:hypothetical protein